MVEARGLHFGLKKRFSDMPFETETLVVAVGGGHSIKPGEHYYQEAVELGRWLARNGYAVRSGGYGGIMEAVSQGVVLGKGRAVAVGLANWPAERRNEYVLPGDYLESSSICRRAEDIFWNAAAMVFFPGGVGTLAELCLVWAGKIMGLIPATTPIILVGEEWHRVLTSLSENLRVFQSHKHHLSVAADVEALITQDMLKKPAKALRSDNDRARWDSQASQWDDDLKSPSHYSNLERSYARFDGFLAQTLANRIYHRDPQYLLDLGCGTGGATEGLRRGVPAAAAWVIDGLDFAPAMVQEAVAKGIYRNAHCATVEQVSHLAEKYHVIFSRGILLSRYTPQQLPGVLRILTERLHDEGLLVFDFLNSIVDDSLRTGGKTRMLFTEISVILRECGFRVTDVEGLGRRTFSVAAIKQPSGVSKIKLVTANLAKYRAHSPLLRECGVELTHWSREIPEIQSPDLQVVSSAKARQLFAQLRCPVMVDDAALLLDAFPGFPGTMTKHILQALKLDGLKTLLSGKSSAATMKCIISIAHDEFTIEQFAGELRGSLVFGRDTDPELPLNSVFVPSGQALSLGEIEKMDAAFLTHRTKALRAACASLKNRRTTG